MSDTRHLARAALIATALAAAVQYGCSSSSNGDGDDTDGGSGSSGGSSSGSGSSGGSGSGGSADGAAGSSGDDATDRDAGAAGTDMDAGQGHDARATGHDAATGADAAEAAETGSPSADGGADPSAWLDPMNAARAAVDAGEAPLTWNPIAAQVALAYAQKCVYEHNPNRDSDYKTAGGGNGGLGENIAAAAPSMTVARADQLWISEDSIYDYATNTCNPTATITECGHYTQIVWKTTTSVGCAIVNCTTGWPFSGTGKDWTYAVCDYAPPGNIVTSPGSTMPERPY
jgi:pathogenesis-related protein 1